MIAVFAFVGIEFLIWGFGIWSICYLYVWPVLVAVTMLTRKKNSYILYCVESGVFGITFGALCAVTTLFIMGPAGALGWWIAGIPFDLIHGISNFLVCLVLYKPIKGYGRNHGVVTCKGGGIAFYRMEKRYKGIFFDLDGTLINTAADLTDAVNYVRELFGLGPVLEEKVIVELGNGIINLLKKFLPDDIKEDDFIGGLRKEFFGYYNENLKKKLALCLWRNLQTSREKMSYRLAVVTNKNDDAAKELTEHFFSGLAEHTIGRTEDVPKSRTRL